ncbi:MAG: ankyrin repeat domain-containing protein [Cyanobacteria bacterium P01_A01_bin.83]
MRIHTYARQGNIQEVAQEIANGVDIDCTDKNNPQTPLMYAVASDNAGIDMVRFLVNNGADINAVENEFQTPVLGLAAKSGNPIKIQFLLDSGANINYQRPGGYDVLIDAMHGRDISKDPNLIPILNLLLDRGAKVNGISSYEETALKVASYEGRFDAVQLLLKADCDRQQLKWTSLMYAIAFGSLKNVRDQLKNQADLKVRDYWQRTPWLLSIEVGDLEKVKQIFLSGIVANDLGIAGQTPLMYAIKHNHFEVLKFLIEKEFDVEATDESNTTPLIVAAQAGATDCVNILLKAGANPSRVNDFGEKAIASASNISIVRMLVEAGADLSEINEEMRRLLTGVGNCELEVSQAQYLAGKQRRFGNTNPEIMEIDFWKAMIRCGISAWSAKSIFNDTDSENEPVWSYDRFGRTITELPNGRVIDIAGEHEDYYDPDFCIYNDVVVYQGNGNFKILGYPKEIFPPTDFHSATLVGEYIYIIGNLGYVQARINQETPVYRLHCKSFKIEKVDTTGEKPGWISNHQAFYYEPLNKIHITGGQVWREIYEKTEYVDNHLSYALNLTTLAWTQIDTAPE